MGRETSWTVSLRTVQESGQSQHLNAVVSGGSILQDKGPLPEHTHRSFWAAASLAFILGGGRGFWVALGQAEDAEVLTLPAAKENAWSALMKVAPEHVVGLELQSIVHQADAQVAPVQPEGVCELDCHVVHLVHGVGDGRAKHGCQPLQAGQQGQRQQVEPELDDEAEVPLVRERLVEAGHALHAGRGLHHPRNVIREAGGHALVLAELQVVGPRDLRCQVLRQVERPLRSRQKSLQLLRGQQILAQRNVPGFVHPAQVELN
mmetsp:Transcript_92995/g.240281  ORF Transcript_92995/g.240281 Transcript_92995/m.240281 type:complete len:262 (-) Transcript_92995:812-1597(-)